MKFRSKTVRVEAHRYQPGEPLPAGVLVDVAEVPGPAPLPGHPAPPPTLVERHHVRDVSGVKHHLSPGDYVIAHEGGHFSRMAAADFEARYEPDEGFLP